MTPSLIVVVFGAIAALAGTVVLARRCAKAPRIFLLAWTAAIFGLAVALAAQSIGDLGGYSGTIFRAMELGGQALAPLALSLASVELAGKSLPARFLMRLGTAAMSVIVVAVLGTDPLNPGFSKVWPTPVIHYQIVPRYLIEVIAAFTLVVAVVTALLATLRSLRGTDRAELVQPTIATAAGAGLVALP